MNNHHFIDDTGEETFDGRTEKRGIVLLSEEGQDKDIVNSVILNEAEEAEAITRYGSNKADDE